MLQVLTAENAGFTCSAAQSGERTSEGRGPSLTHIKPPPEGSGEGPAWRRGRGSAWARVRAAHGAVHMNERPLADVSRPAHGEALFLLPGPVPLANHMARLRGEGAAEETHRDRLFVLKGKTLKASDSFPPDQELEGGAAQNRNGRWTLPEAKMEENSRNYTEGSTREDGLGRQSKERRWGRGLTDSSTRKGPTDVKCVKGQTRRTRVTTLGRPGKPAPDHACAQLDKQKQAAHVRIRKCARTGTAGHARAPIAAAGGGRPLVGSGRGAGPAEPPARSRADAEGWGSGREPPRGRSDGVRTGCRLRPPFPSSRSDLSAPPAGAREPGPGESSPSAVPPPRGLPGVPRGRVGSAGGGSKEDPRPRPGAPPGGSTSPTARPGLGPAPTALRALRCPGPRLSGQFPRFAMGTWRRPGDACVVQVARGPLGEGTSRERERRASARRLVVGARGELQGLGRAGSPGGRNWGAARGGGRRRPWVSGLKRESWGLRHSRILNFPGRELRNGGPEGVKNLHEATTRREGMRNLNPGPKTHTCSPAGAPCSQATVSTRPAPLPAGAQEDEPRGPRAGGGGGIRGGAEDEAAAAAAGVAGRTEPSDAGGGQRELRTRRLRQRPGRARAPRGGPRGEGRATRRRRRPRATLGGPARSPFVRGGPFMPPPPARCGPGRAEQRGPGRRRRRAGFKGSRAAACTGQGGRGAGGARGGRSQRRPLLPRRAPAREPRDGPTSPPPARLGPPRRRSRPPRQKVRFRARRSQLRPPAGGGALGRPRPPPRAGRTSGGSSGWALGPPAPRSPRVEGAAAAAEPGAPAGGCALGRAPPPRGKGRQGRL
ncbi:collagen alpha-1(I) chain-like [Neovison vison]|uniref:collagen alpha-1(I) chain-like n=1 Tax=Neovison vison TaxID=452646 RepID=UPI001CEFEF6F|nr:collagen alpha-1(I) chain-like [Neogale vison]